MHSGPFGCLTKLDAKRAELPQKFVPRRHVGIFLQRMHSIRPIGPQTDVLVHFVLFGCIRDRLVALRNSMQNGPNYRKCSCHEDTWVFFATNALDPPHWTPKLRSGAFCAIWVHSGPFGCLTKLGSKQAEIVQMFVPRSRVGIFLQGTHPIHPIGP